ncbi:hypothetical protein GYMLUDRAFT_406719 [Collybiopsis luxurians FD-317 M1]|uniref:Uncharacterized protein n=1 Tax=Collybiopsis luxurians FD-317 M1 TaxID=944289 RepID=A0A0D0ALN2_9AGAR|nr:hypothetical protein GYMLUDRAFT_406719 [Collybiopsis luxurians FD-317 M1]
MTQRKAMVERRKRGLSNQGDNAQQSRVRSEAVYTSLAFVFLCQLLIFLSSLDSCVN